MRTTLLSCAIGLALALRAFAAPGGHGGGSGMAPGHSSMSMGHVAQPGTHGAAVSAAAHDAKQSGGKVGPQVRDVARSKSQGPSHANSHAINAVNGSHGKAASNSVLGNGGSTTGATSNGHGHNH